MKQNLRFFMLALLCAVSNFAWGDRWVEVTDITELDANGNDIIVIVDKTTSKAMSNDNGTTNPPSAVSVTLSTDQSEITSTVAEAIMWRFIKNQDNFQFQKYATTANSNYLYTINDNNGVRVGDNAGNNKFVMEDGFLKNVTTGRYIGVYQNEWHGFAETNNISNTQIAFYKKQTTTQTTSTATLTNANIVAAGNANSGYSTWEITDGNNKKWNAYAIKNKHSNDTQDYHFLQIKKYASNTAYYIQIPQYGTKITSIKMTVSSTQKPMDEGGNSATLYFSNSNTTSAPGTGVASATGASSVTINCSTLNLNTGYITASGAVRIWDVTVTYLKNGSTTYTVTYDCNGGESGCPSNLTVADGTEISLADAPKRTGYIFDGWSDGTTTYDAGASYTVTQDVTFTAQWSKGTETWVKTDLTNLTESDVFVFVGKRNGVYYAMSYEKYEDTRPPVVSVSVSTDETLLNGPISDVIKWNIEEADGGYYFHPNGDKNNYLHWTGGTTLHVGPGTGTDNKIFNLASNGYLSLPKITTPRYLGIYNNNNNIDWRPYQYNDINEYIPNQTFAFYKKVINLDLKEGEDNSSIIDSNDGKHVNVNLTRTLFGGMWNAICLPFAMTDAQRTTLFGTNYVLQEMSSAELDANGTAQLNFTKVDASAPTVAGTPYLVKPIQDVTSAVINDVKIVKATNGKPAPVENNGYKFQGIYNPTALADMGADPENILFLGRGSQLLTPSTDSKPMKGFRAYFILNSSNGASGLSLTTEDGGIINSISLAEVDGLYTNMDNNRVYSISGQYIGTKTEGLAKGIYIVNGRKFIVK